MKTDIQTLKDAIFIHNEYKKIATPILEHIKKVCTNFIGKKIDTQKGLSAKFADAIKIDRESIKVNPLPGTKWANLHFLHVRNSYNDLSVEISLCFSDGSTGCTYEKHSYYFGKTENGVLLSVNNDCEVYQVTLDFDTELAKIKKFRELEKMAEDARDKILVSRDVYKYFN